MHTVAHYVDTAAFGGTEKIVLALLTGMDRSRWRPVLFHHPEPGLAPLLHAAQQAGVATRAVSRVNGYAKPVRLLQFASALRSEAPSVFHAHLSSPLACKSGLLAASLLRVPAIVATAQLFMHLREKQLARRLSSWGVHRYLAVSDAVSRKLQENLGLPARKIRVVRNGVPLAQNRCPRNERLRQELLGGMTRPMVLTLARLDPQKGLPYLLEAAVNVPGALFVIAGEGDERRVLEARAQTLGVQDRVLFLGHRDDVHDLLAACDLFVLPSLFEGFPLSVLEASAAGKPLIATAVDGTSEAIRDGETGLLVPPADPAALAAAINRLLGDSGLAARLGSAAAVYARQTFGVDRMVEAVTATYDELLASSRA